MRCPRFVFLGLLSALLGLGLGCQTASHPSPPPPELPAALKDRSSLNEILRYVYRWHFDDSRFIAPSRNSEIELWLRARTLPLDPGDRSEFAELWIPGPKLAVELKRAEYTVPELKLEVHETQYQVERVNRLEAAPAAKSQYTILRFPAGELMDYLTQTRSQRVEPTPEQRRHVRESVLRYLSKSFTNSITDTQTFFLAPLTPVANDVWIYYLNRQLLLHLNADLSLTNPAFWNNTTLNLKVISLENSVLVSPEQVPGSNAFVTRDWIGRVLYNCVVLGQRIDVPAETINGYLHELGLQ